MFVVMCNAPPDQAETIARTLVEEHLAACVNVVPAVTSYYFWEGALQRDAEAALWIKVPKEKMEALSQRIREIHPYHTVEILALPVDVERSDPAYVAWVRRLA